MTVERSGIEAVWLADPAAVLLKITFWEHKKRRNWTVHVTNPVAQSIRMQMSAYPKTKWLFPGREKGKHLSSRQAYNRLQAVLKRAGLRQRPFHALRATCMKMCQRKGWSKEQTMELTGDSYETVEQHYLTPSDDEMQEVTIAKPLVGKMPKALDLGE